MTTKKLASIPMDRVLGGVVFGAIAGTIGFASATQSAASIAQGLCLGAFIGGMIALEIHALFKQDVPWPRIHRTPIHCRSSIVYGMTLTRNFCLFAVVPFTVGIAALIMAALVVVSTAMEGFPSGARLWNSVSDDVFWFEGLCVHALLLASVVSLLIEWPFYRMGARRQ